MGYYSFAKSVNPERQDPLETKVQVQEKRARSKGRTQWSFFLILQ